MGELSVASKKTQLGAAQRWLMILVGEDFDSRLKIDRPDSKKLIMVGSHVLASLIVIGLF